VFDNEMIAQAGYFSFRMREISSPTVYFEDASSIDFRRSVQNSFGILAASIECRLQKWDVAKHPLFSIKEKGLMDRG
jgi:hypothetical protein